MSRSPKHDNENNHTTSELDLHQLPDDKPVFACHKCSEVVVSSTHQTCRNCSMVPRNAS
jgi:hypothetical protein